MTWNRRRHSRQGSRSGQWRKESDESWHFTHETGLEFNVVWSLCRDIFKHPELLYDKSVDIAETFNRYKEQYEAKNDIEIEA